MLGDIHIVYDWDWDAADAEFKRRGLLRPTIQHLVLAAQQSLIFGRWDDALKFINASLAQDPLSSCAYYDCSTKYRYGAAISPRRKPPFAAHWRSAHIYLRATTTSASCYSLAVKRQAALTEIEGNPTRHVASVGSAIAYFALGRKGDSDAALAQMLKSQPNARVDIAQVYAFRGESDEAFRWLDRAYAQKDPNSSALRGTPLKNLEGDPRYKAFLKKMNLPE